jgi:hypothetical protein
MWLPGSGPRVTRAAVRAKHKCTNGFLSAKRLLCRFHACETSRIVYHPMLTNVSSKFRNFWNSIQ